jgi:hypothetical protein
MEYVHLEVGENVNALAGSYTPLKELRLEHNGREVLCVIGMSTVEGACCNLDGSYGYAIVPGYIVTWKDRKNDSELAVSEVEPIADEMTKREIAGIIGEAEAIQNIDFW